MHYFKPSDTNATGAPPAAAFVWPLFVLTALLWLVFGTVSLVHFGGSIGTWIVALLMLGNAALLLFAGWGVRAGKWGFYYLALAVLGVNVLMTITDQFGLFDLIYLVVAGGLFVLLLVLRGHYARRSGW